MSNPARYVSRSVRTAYIASVIGLTLVLLILGVGAWGVFKVKEIKKSVVETTVMDVFFKNHVNEADKIRLEKDIKQMAFVRSADKISSEEALEVTRGELSIEEAEELMGDFPFPSSIQIKIKEDYVSVDSLDKYQNYLQKNYSDIVMEAYYNKERVKDIEVDTSTSIIIVLVIAALLLIVAIALIYNTIRLAIYSKRFSLKTMTLVGAKTSYIRRPFLLSAIIQGALAGILSVSLLIAIVYMMQKLGLFGFNVIKLADSTTFIYIFGILIVFGILISFLSTFFALRKYIRIKTDKLY